MKKIIALLLIVCSCSAFGWERQLTYDELMRINLSNLDCVNIDKWINYFETLLQQKGMLHVDPETLSNEDRLYNARIRAMIWGLRVGCENPNRYKK
jgi:hypothetical protein